MPARRKFLVSAKERSVVATDHPSIARHYVVKGYKYASASGARRLTREDGYSHRLDNGLWGRTAKDLHRTPA
jgi:hypothetical protein